MKTLVVLCFARHDNDQQHTKSIMSNAKGIHKQTRVRIDAATLYEVVYHSFQDVNQNGRLITDLCVPARVVVQESFRHAQSNIR